MLRVLARIVMFLFSALHWLLVTIADAHLTVLRNFAPRASVLKHEQVKRD